MALITSYGMAWSKTGLGGYSTNLTPQGYQSSSRSSTTARKRPKILDIRSATPLTRERIMSSSLRGQGYFVRNVPAGSWTEMFGYEPLGVDDIKSTYYNMWHYPTQSMLNALRTELLLKIKGQNVNLALNCAELRKASDTVADVGKDLYDFCRKLRSGRTWRDFRRALNGQLKSDPTKGLARQWLRYAYGISPTLSDISNACDMLASKINQGMSVRVTASRTYHETVNSIRGVGGKEIMALKAYALYTVDNAGGKIASSVGATNPAALGWELIPYSFVVDWFVNVGDYLSSLDALTGVSNLSYITVTRFRRKLLGQGWSASNLATIPYGIYKGEFEFYDRSGIYTDLSVRGPSYNPHFSVRRALSSISLLRGTLK